MNDIGPDGYTCRRFGAQCHSSDQSVMNCFPNVEYFTLYPRGSLFEISLRLIQRNYLEPFLGTFRSEAFVLHRMS
jgi:hypothetical protein